VTAAASDDNYGLALLAVPADFSGWEIPVASRVAARQRSPEPRGTPSHSGDRHGAWSRCLASWTVVG
jgi:hypothetical protein